MSEEEGQAPGTEEEQNSTSTSPESGSAGEAGSATPPATPPAPTSGTSGLDLDQLGGAIGRGLAAGMRELGLGAPQKSEKSEEKPGGSEGDAGTGGDQNKRRHWFFGD